VPELKTLAQAVQADWQTLGVPTAVEYFEPSDLTQNVIRPRKYDVLLFGMVVGRDRDLYAFWNSAEKADPGLNIALYTNKAVDQLLEDARTETDPGARRQELAKIESLVAADYPAAFIESPDFVYVLPKDVHGVSLTQIAAPSDRFASAATWYRHIELVWPFLARSS
jgi:peptide/nickel transport system substrate-binding protein